MSLWLAGVMGLVQGLTEYIPVSSSAHLRIVPTLLGQPDPGAAYTAVLQLGTLLAVLVYFARELFITLPRAMVKAPRSPEGQLIWKIGVASLPIAILGLMLEKRIDTDLRSLWIVAGTLIGVGILMWIVDERARGERGTFDLSWLEVFVIGCAQACALCPGVSRSGSTICAALLLGMSRKEAARFSFLLGIPAVGAAGIYKLKQAHDALGSDAVMPLLVGNAVSFVVGYFAVAWLLRFLGTHRLWTFSAYRIAIGAALIALLAANVITANAGA